MADKLTKNEEAAIEQYRRGLLSVNGVATALGISRHFAEKLLRQTGVKIRNPFEEALARHAREGKRTRSDLTKKEIDDVVSLYRDGAIASQVEAAKKLGVSQQTFRRYLIERNITPRHRGEVEEMKKETAKQRNKREAVQTITVQGHKYTRETWPDGFLLTFDEYVEQCISKSRK